MLRTSVCYLKSCNSANSGEYFLLNIVLKKREDSENDDVGRCFLNKKRVNK